MTHAWLLSGKTEIEGHCKHRSYHERGGPGSLPLLSVPEAILHERCGLGLCVRSLTLVWVLQLCKDFGFKSLAHIMPDLPGSSPELDMKAPTILRSAH